MFRVKTREIILSSERKKVADQSADVHAELGLCSSCMLKSGFLTASGQFTMCTPNQTCCLDNKLLRA